MDTEIRLAELGEQMKVANHRIDDLEETTKRIESLTLSVERLTMSVQSLVKSQNDSDNRANDLAQRIMQVERAPFNEKADKFDAITRQIATLIIGALVGYLLKTFLGI